ncbi:hypothetical protein Q8A67_006047 [Cirrhinus molitorella]|uniref:Ig-like domain-containing protein n=1 Tax=Cirrhinus molitorella TaxID=172907 RepID=A0AA88PZH2_9TELE|nr:hypothetical protein Q8A67_006047 [Cirrhinus molitorella]
MDQLCSTIFFLLLTGHLINRTSQEELSVHLEPKYIHVCEGESITINCTFQPGGTHKVSWHYSQKPDLGCDSNKIPEEQRFHTNRSDTWATLNINSTKTNDSGWYFCMVTKDIPVLEKKCSNGTQVQVDVNITKVKPTQMPNQTDILTTQDSPKTCLITTTAIPTTSSTKPFSIVQWWIWLAIAVGCVVLVVTIVCIYMLTRKPKDIIYENTKPVESRCWRHNRTKMDICDLPASKKTDTIKPLRKLSKQLGFGRSLIPGI